MRRKLLLCAALIAVAATAAAQSVTVTFTARSNSGSYHRFDSVRVENLTQGWSQRLAYPDTTLVLGSTSGIATAESAGAVELKVYPNPFAGRAESLLQLNEDDNVSIRVLDVKGSLVAGYSGYLAAGGYRLAISLSEPQVAFLSVSTRSGRSVAKMVNTAAGGTDRIEVAPFSMPVQRPTAKAVAFGPFSTGDRMSYTAVCYDGGERTLSNNLTQAQTAGGLVTLVFVESGNPTAPVVTTSAVSDVTTSTATCGGNVTDDGGQPVTARGVCWSTSVNPPVADSHTPDGTGTGSFTSSITGLAAGTTYYVRAYATNSVGTAYGAQVTFTTTATQNVPDGYVDLGLPSGLLWATCNIGASNPEDYGNYYAWGETQTKSDYSWSTYAYGSDYNQLTKYCNNSSYGLNGFTDNLTTLEAGDDVATQVLGNGARIPTKAEWQELLDNTTAEWTTVNGVYGRKYTASNGNSLFLPAAGYRYGSGLYGAGSYGNYWSASLYEGSPYNAWYMYFSSDGQYVDDSNRSDGFSVRAVRSQN